MSQIQFCLILFFSSCLFSFSGHAQRAHSLYGKTRGAQENFIGGESKFDQLVKKYGMPNSFAELLQVTAQETGSKDNLALIPIPQGRALSRAELARYTSPAGIHFYDQSRMNVLANDDFFKYPRWTLGITGQQKTQNINAIYLRDQLYYGYNEKQDILEVISYNEMAKRFEFQLVRRLTARTRKIEYTNRKLCLTCHQNRGPLFPKIGVQGHGLWDETMDNFAYNFTRGGRVNDFGKRYSNKMPLVKKAARRLNISQFLLVKDDPAVLAEQNNHMLKNGALDNGIQAANWINYGRNYWDLNCSELKTAKKTAQCRQSIFFAATFTKALASKGTPHIPMKVIESLLPVSRGLLNPLILKRFQTSFHTHVLSSRIKNRNPVDDLPFPVQYGPEVCQEKLPLLPMCPRHIVTIRPNIKGRKKTPLILTDQSIASFQGQFIEDLSQETFLKNAFTLFKNFLSYNDALTLIDYSEDRDSFSEFNIAKKGATILKKLEYFAKRVKTTPQEFWQKQKTYVRKKVLQQFLPINTAPRQNLSHHYTEGKTTNQLNFSSKKYAKGIKYCGACHRGGALNIFGGSNDREIGENVRKFSSLIPLRAHYAKVPEGEGMPPIISKEFKILAEQVTQASWPQILQRCEKTPDQTLQRCVTKMAVKCERILVDKQAGINITFGKCTK